MLINLKILGMQLALLQIFNGGTNKQQMKNNSENVNKQINVTVKKTKLLEEEEEKDEKESHLANT